MNIKEDLAGVRLEARQQAVELAEKFVDTISDHIFKIASSEEIIATRWIMVHLDPKSNEVNVSLAVRDYVLIDHKLNSLFNLFDPESVKISTTQKKLYKQHVYSELKDFLNEQGFVNIETELPLENGKERPDSEYFEWYAFEVL